jgi:hypothetical protein
MYLLILGWLYVAIMMTVAEAANPAGTVLGAFITFVLYGAIPVALLTYLLGWPARKKSRDEAAKKSREKAEEKSREEAAGRRQAADSGSDVDGGGEAPADPVAPVRKET